MIPSFRSREMERVFNRLRSGRPPPDIQRVALRNLRMLDAAATPADLHLPPSNCLEALHGDRECQYSIRINDRY
ncbi:MAG: type II toxin-antitoxin system RelE/ParE family toxin [Anaerolineae bacterium]